MSKLSDPFIKLKPMQCFDCMIPIRVYENESNDIEVNIEGIPISVDTIQYKVIGICPICGRIYKLKRDKLSFCITTDLEQYLNSGGINHDEGNEEEKQYCNEFGYDKCNNR